MRRDERLRLNSRFREHSGCESRRCPRTIVCLRETSLKKQKGLASSRLRAARCVESAPSLMKKDPDPNSADSAEIEALITRLERGQAMETRSCWPDCFGCCFV